MKITPELIRKYLNNSCSAEEREAVDAWYQSSEQGPDPLRLMNEGEQDSLQRSLYSRFKSSLVDQGTSGSRHLMLGNRFATLFFAVASMAALILFFFKVNLANQPLSAIASNGGHVQIAFRNAGNSIYKKVLPDNSTVWLSPNSTLTYPEKFNGHYRNVTLTGEAFFEVTKDKKHPFIISSNSIITKVWGTSFRVRAIKNLPAEVAVMSGKVSVNSKDRKEEVMLLSNQKVTLASNKHLVKDVSSDIKNEMRIWKKVSLSFNDVQLSQVFSALNKNFNIRIYSNQPKLNSLEFTGDFTDQSLPAILDMIKESVNASYAIEGGKAFVFETNNTL
jgi:transmembrane sensor